MANDNFLKQSSRAIVKMAILEERWAEWDHKARMEFPTLRIAHGLGERRYELPDEEGERFIQWLRDNPIPCT